VPLHLSGGTLFPQLATKTLIAPVDLIWMHVANELLSDGARAAAIAEDVVLDRAGDADDVNAIVLVETLVFDGHKCLADVPRKRSNRNAAPYLGAYFAYERPVSRKNL
jgi:hypothetical protein